VGRVPLRRGERRRGPNPRDPGYGSGRRSYFTRCSAKGCPRDRWGAGAYYRTPRRPPCGCGNRGCLEALASGTAIARRAQKVANERPDSALGRLAAERAPLGEDVLDLALGGDEASEGVLQETGTWLGIGLATFVNIFDPEVIAIGGGVSEAGDLVLDPARRELRLPSHSPSRDLVEIREATLGAKFGMPGAAALAREEDGEYCWACPQPARRRRANTAGKEISR
jgi:predicted NBD/HSP70 family sugar kinase